MRIWLGVFNHQSLGFGVTPAKILALSQDSIDHPPGIISRRKIQVQIAFDRLDAADAFQRSNMYPDLLGDLMGSLRDRLTCLPAPASADVILLVLAVFVRERSDRAACLWQESPPTAAPLPYTASYAPAPVRLHAKLARFLSFLKWNFCAPNYSRNGRRRCKEA